MGKWLLQDVKAAIWPLADLLLLLFVSSRINCVLSFFRPGCIAHIVAILWHDYWARYPAPDLPLYAIHHTLLVITISCESQGCDSNSPRRGDWVSRLLVSFLIWNIRLRLWGSGSYDMWRLQFQFFALRGLCFSTFSSVSYFWNSKIAVKDERLLRDVKGVLQLLSKRYR